MRLLLLLTLLWTCVVGEDPALLPLVTGMNRSYIAAVKMMVEHHHLPPHLQPALAALQLSAMDAMRMPAMPNPQGHGCPEEGPWTVTKNPFLPPSNRYVVGVSLLDNILWTPTQTHTHAHTCTPKQIHKDHSPTHTHTHTYAALILCLPLLHTLPHSTHDFSYISTYAWPCNASCPVHYGTHCNDWWRRPSWANKSKPWPVITVC
jgi:hypothetical protein